MAAISALSQDFEGTDATTANAGSVGATQITGGGTVTFSAADPQQGTTALQLVGGATAQASIEYNITPVTTFWAGFYFKTPSVAPSAATTIANWLGDSGVNLGGAVRLNADMTLSIRDNATARYTTPTALPVNTWCRIAIKAVPGSATGHRLKVYVGANRHGLTADFDSGNVAATNGVNTNISTFHVGLITNGANTVFLDRLRGDDAAEPAGITAGLPPTVSAGPDLTKEVGSSVFTITGTATASSGATIASRSWQVLSGAVGAISGTTTNTVTITPPASTIGTAVLRFTATDNTGQSTSDDVTLTWVAAGQTLYPAADVQNLGGWTRSGTTATTLLYSVLDDVVLDTNDYASSPQLSVLAQTFRVRLQSKPAPTNTSGWYLSINLSVTPDTISSSVVVKLYEADGTTLRKTWAAITTGTTADAEYQLSLTSAEVSSITSWTSGLILEISATGS